MLKKALFLTAIVANLTFQLNQLLAAVPIKDELKLLHQKLSESNNDTSRVTANLNISWHFMHSSTDSALIYGKKAYFLSKKTKYGLIKASMNLATAYEMVGDFENSLKYRIEAMNEAQKAGDEKNYAIILSGMGSDYLYMSDYAMAYKYFNQALKISKDYRGKIVALVNLGQVCASLDDKVKYSQAHDYYNNALKLAEEAKNYEDQAIIYNRIAELYLMEENYNQSIYYVEKSLKFFDNKEPHSYYRVDDLKILTENYILTGRYEKGIKLAKHADSLAQEGGYMVERKQLNSFLSELYDSLRNPAMALIYFKKYSTVKDSLYTIEKSSRMNFLQADFETKQHEMEAKHYQQEAAFNKKLSYIYLLLITLILLTLFYFIKNIRQKVKILKYEQERLVQQKEKEKLEKKTLELELDKKHREILTHAIQINQQKELFTSVLSDVNNITKVEEPEKVMNAVKQLVVDIKNKIDLSDDWDQIKLHFENVHPDFFTKVKNNFPDISINDLKLIAYTKLKFSNKEISRLLNINPSSVQVSRYRLKKKMNLHEDVNLLDYIITLE